MKFLNSRTAELLQENHLLSIKESGLFQTLIYFDIFDFPLTFSELYKFSSFSSIPEFKECLNTWVESGYIIRENEYYLLDNSGSKVEQRWAGEERVSTMWAKACKRAKLIQRFPFVRAVFISGSVSKGVVAEDGDVDFFIITEPGRLWLCRTLLAMYKKLIFGGSHKYFCINYFIDSEYLQIEEQNRYTATELVTLIPMTGDKDLILDFFEANCWTEKYYPNFREQEVRFPNSKGGHLKSALEIVLNLLGGNLLNKAGRWLTTTFWKLKFRDMSKKDFDIALKSEDHVSKHHPLNFQKYVLNKMSENVEHFENANGLKLDV